MGKQVNFFLLAGDELSLLQRVKELGDFTIYRQASRDRPRPLELPLPPANASADPFDLLLAIIPRAFPVRVRSEFVRPAGQHVLDQMDSEAVEFSRSQLVDGATRSYGPAPATPWVALG